VILNPNHPWRSDSVVLDEIARFPKGANWNLGDAADAIAAGFTALRALQRHLNGISRKAAEKFHARASSSA
jgi:hypothetical protein